jgi:hypothetical protein
MPQFTLPLQYERHGESRLTDSPFSFNHSPLSHEALLRCTCASSRRSIFRSGLSYSARDVAGQPPRFGVHQLQPR